MKYLTMTSEGYYSITDTAPVDAKKMPNLASIVALHFCADRKNVYIEVFGELERLENIAKAINYFAGYYAMSLAKTSAFAPLRISEEEFKDQIEMIADHILSQADLLNSATNKQ